MIERTYSKHIVDHSDALVRQALLQPEIATSRQYRAAAEGLTAVKRPEQLWRRASRWVQHDWVPFNKAFVRIKSDIGSSSIALLDLHQHIVAGRLRTAARWISGGKDLQLVLKCKRQSNNPSVKQPSWSVAPE